MKQSGHLNPSEETGTGCPVTSKYGRTPLNKHGRTPLNKHGRTPLNKHGRTPLNKHGRTPLNKHGRTPLNKHGRTPLNKHGRTPLNKHGGVGRQQQQVLSFKGSQLLRQFVHTSVYYYDSLYIQVCIITTVCTYKCVLLLYIFLSYNFFE